MAVTVDYLLYDVFTDTPFTGNPLAVAVDPPELSDDDHHRIANELNLSETVFLRRNGGAWDTRIFSPGGEMPFAGHPTIGAAIALADEGLVTDSVVLTEKVGPVPVTIDGGLATLTTAQAPESVTPVADPGDIAATLGLSMADLHREIGPSAWSAGLPFTIVTVADVATLGRVAIDQSRWAEAVLPTPGIALYVLAPLDGIKGRNWRARMFSPGFGIAEDPATGSAAAATCGYLAGHAGADRIEEGWIIEQGVEMGRASTIHVGAVLRGAELVAATVGGRAVRVGHGQLRIG